VVALESIDRLKVTASSHKRAFLVEVMGRNCGYLALMAGIAGGAESVVIPEAEIEPEAIAAGIQSAYDRGKAHALVERGARAAARAAVRVVLLVDRVGLDDVGALPHEPELVAAADQRELPRLPARDVDRPVDVAGGAAALDRDDHRLPAAGERNADRPAEVSGGDPVRLARDRLRGGNRETAGPDDRLRSGEVAGRSGDRDGEHPRSFADLPAVEHPASACWASCQGVCACSGRIVDRALRHTGRGAAAPHGCRCRDSPAAIW
jgi:hypothetical protein